jgi:hypothetical protein
MNMKKFSRNALLITIVVFLAVPLLASAQTGINISYITPYSSGIIGVINTILVPVLIAIAFIVFLWGVYKYFIWGAANESEKADGRKFAMWGIIGFVIILSLWGLVNLVMGTFGLSVGTAPAFPTIGGSAPAGRSGANIILSCQNDPNPEACRCRADGWTWDSSGRACNPP